MKRLNQRKRYGVSFSPIYMKDPEGGGGGSDPPPSDPPPSDPPADPPSDPPADPPANYFQALPEDWRTQAVKTMGFEDDSDDFKKHLAQLERVSDFSVFSKNYFSAQDKIRKGEISNGLPENPTDEQMASYREANGVPEAADAYELSLEDGLVLGEADERIMGPIYEIAHAANIPTEAMSAMTNAMLQGRLAEADAQNSQDGIDKQTSDRQLKESWGGDFDANLNMVRGLVNTLPESIKEHFESARLSDGKALFNSPEVMVAMAEWARKINPAATVVPSSNNPMQTMNDEIKTLEDRMGEPGWHKDTDAQKRYQDLITARDNMKAQSA